MTSPVINVTLQTKVIHLSHCSAITHGILPVSQPPNLRPKPQDLKHSLLSPVSDSVMLISPLPPAPSMTDISSILSLFACLSSSGGPQVPKVNKCSFSFTCAQIPAASWLHTLLTASQTVDDQPKAEQRFPGKVLSTVFCGAGMVLF